MHNRLLNIVTEYKKEAYTDVILQKPDAQLIYHLSPQRHTIIDFFEWTGTEQVLELAAGCGAITEALAERAGFVCAITGSADDQAVVEKRLQSAQNLSCETLELSQPSACEERLEQLRQTSCPQGFDVVTLIGVTEQLSHINGQILQELIQLAYRLLKEDGVLLYAGPNRYGMKYFAGAKEDRLHKYFAGIEGYSGETDCASFSQKELQRMFDSAGFLQTECYYPHQDYRLPLTIYSDRRLPAVGELKQEMANYDDDRMALFDEGHAFDGVITEGMYPFFANSYLIQANKGNGRLNAPDYARFAVDRSPAFAVKTAIRGKQVYKTAVYPEGRTHIAHICEAWKHLSEQYGEKLTFNRIPEQTQDQIRLEYVEGESLNSRINRLLARGDTGLAYELLEQLQQLLTGVPQTEFVMTEEFRQVFGQSAAEKLAKSGLQFQTLQYSDIDLIPQNVLKTPDGDQVIDYEWTFDFPIPVEYIVYRGLWMTAMENDGYEAFEPDRLLARFGIDRRKREIFDAMEAGFQAYVCGGKPPLRSTLLTMKRRFTDIRALDEKIDKIKKSPIGRWL